ncbi:MAG: TetR/AcrR family transcriptional regulator [Nitrospirota bacterium]
MKSVPVIDQILDLAQRLVQTRGYNAMSYRDLADQIGIKTSSIHYYFPAKEDLGRALMTRYRQGIQSALAGIDAKTTDPRVKIERYVELFREAVRSGRICLGGMLATDLTTLPRGVQAEVKTFFTENEAWVANVLEAGRESGAFTFEGPSKGKAATVFAALEGAMIAARLFNDDKRLVSAADWLLDTLATPR